MQVDRGTELKDAYWQKNIIKSFGGLINGLIDNDCFLLFIQIYNKETNKPKYVFDVEEKKYE